MLPLQISIVDSLADCQFGRPPKGYGKGQQPQPPQQAVAPTATNVPQEPTRTEIAAQHAANMNIDGENGVDPLAKADPWAKGKGNRRIRRSPTPPLPGNPFVGLGFAPVHI